ncbi:hypothetical protein K502DRAFT_324710 [Neoconidiobolus thromboides FSU 785]|nr:hypothetical protein K502DRAFT_324710 [Neoconidiobolus thromboides FSU 785]
MKATLLLSLLSLISGSLAVYGEKPKCSKREIRCETDFGRLANGDGTNTYSFGCKCKIEYNGEAAEPICKITGKNITNQCQTGTAFLISNNVSFQVNECNLGNATTTVTIKDAAPKKVFVTLDKCTPQGVAGLNCVGTSKF